MLLADIVKLLTATSVSSVANLDQHIENAGASDLMSDVLALTKPESVLLTGLCTPQVVRTAEMVDLKAIVFVRNKWPDAVTVKLADEMGLPLFSSPFPLYEACGLLYQAGLPGLLDRRDPNDHWLSVAAQDGRRSVQRTTGNSRGSL
ncbi:MAG: hypothetical protein IT209_09645 [Armatimonadetes bacterium]|nr:hypothetical protein [Armatimonadota bacterium]